MPFLHSWIVFKLPKYCDYGLMGICENAFVFHAQDIFDG